MTAFLAGTEVTARGLRWVVADSQSMGQQRLYRLRCLEGTLAGREFDLLHPFERIEPIVRAFRPERAAPLPNWLVYHQAFVLDQALGPEGMAAVQAGRLKVEPYQLVPVVRAIRMSRVRLLLADGVGLGKTIQAGLILTEMIARRLAHRILIVTPSGPLLEQWMMEMSLRFGLRLEQIDSAKLNEIRRSTELGANPFDSIPLGIASIDFLKQERILELLERASYDVVVLDEAHHCMDLGTSGDNREDSLRRRLAEVLASRCDSLVLATATPHDGNDRSFASLCELLDPSLLDGRGMLRGERYRAHVVRRLKNHIFDPVTKQPRFRERSVHPIPVVASPEQHGQFMALQKELLDLVAPELKRAFRTRRYSDVLAFISLLKRSVSTADACVRTLTAVADRFRRLREETEENQETARQRLRSLRELQRKVDRFGAITAEEEQEQRDLEVEEIAQKLSALQREGRAGSRDVARLTHLSESFDRILTLGPAAQQQDPKLQVLLAQIRAIRAQEPRANILIYTEYMDSQAAAIAYLKAANIGEIISMNGEDGTTDRTKTTDRFRSVENLLLISTDAAAEGLNLHQRCHHLIHLELPFNPNRLEQRNGRIDRFGQNQDPIVRYLYLRGTFEERILLRLIAKYERQRRMLTFVPNTLGITSSTDAATERLLAGIMDDEAKLFRQEPVLFDLSDGRENEGADDATRELLEEIDRSLRGFERAAASNSWLGNSGLNAEESLAVEASAVRDKGAALGGVDLAAFVRQAVRLEGGDERDFLQYGYFELMLPPAWAQGLDRPPTPGFDPDSRRIRLTHQLDILSTPAGDEVGFLGRAHPLVRRALDRVRQLSFGAAQGEHDPRVSAAYGDVSAPTLLCTYVGRINSRAGRELERLFAVRVTHNGAAEVLPDNHAWLGTIQTSTGARTAGVWESRFAAWASAAESATRTASEAFFAPLAREFETVRATEVADERERQLGWLRQRCLDIIGNRVPAAEQFDFLATPSNGRAAHRSQRPFPQWHQLADPLEKLAAFASDSMQPSALRHAADTVLRIFRQRMAELEARAQILSPDLVPVGMLMILPLEKRRS